MNKLFAKCVFLFFLSGIVSIQLFTFGAVEREHLLFTLLVLYGFGLVGLRLGEFVDWLTIKKERDQAHRIAP